MKDDTIRNAAENLPLNPSTLDDDKDRSSKLSLRHTLYCIQRNLSLTTQRTLLLVFILLQATLFVGHLIYQRHIIEDNASRVLHNTALLQAQQFENSLAAMRYQVQVIGSAILLNHTVPANNVDSFLEQELKQDWLDAVIIFDADGDFVAKRSLFPLEQVLSASTLANASLQDCPLLKKLRQENVNERLFYWQGSCPNPNVMGLVIYRAIRDPQGRYLGGVIGYFNSSTMAKLFMKMENRGLQLGSSGSIAVVDRDNNIQLARMGAGAGPIKPGQKVSELMNYASDSAQVYRYVSPVDDIPRLGVFLNLNDRKWVLVVGLAERDILRGWYFQALWTTIVVIILALLQWRLLHHVRTIYLQRARLAQEARQDPLTGLANRRRFNEWSLGACSLARRHHQALCVLTLDLDFFKKINDRYGHDGGDAVLKCVGKVLQRLLRDSDIAARFGGEEFVVAMAHTELEAAAEVAERIRAHFAAQEVEFNSQKIRFTASFGLTQITPDELEVSEGIDSALARADQALYRSKQEGRNRVTIVH